MELEIYKKPCLLLEAAELVCAVVNNIPAEKLTVPDTYAIPPEAVRTIQEAACAGLSPEDRQLQFYFRGFPLFGVAERLFCLGCCLLYTSVEVSCNGVDDMAQALCDGWTRRRREDYRIDGIYPFSLRINVVNGREFTALSDEIAPLPVPQSYKMQLVEVFSAFDYHVSRVAELLRPVADALEVLLAPWVERATPLMNQWERFFREHGVNEFLLRRAQLKFGQVKTLQIAFRYFAPDPSPLYFDEKTGCVSIHMGMSIRPDPNDRGAVPTLDDLDHSALRLLANPDRVEMLRLMMNRPMGVPELSKRLQLNSGSVFRDVNSMYNAKLLLFQPENGKNLYCTNLSAVVRITSNLVEYIRSGEEI